MGRNFISDHVAPACDAIMSAVNKANEGYAASYGGDELTAKLQSVASEVFEKQVAVFPVTSGTAANALALSQIVPTFGAIYCAEAAHIVTDEAGAPGFFTGGAQLVGFPASDGKIQPAQLTKAVAYAEELGIHHVKPGAVTLTQATEWGTVYEIGEVSAITEVARQHKLPVHMDGARFANALVHLGLHAGAGDLEVRRRCAVAGRHQERCPGRRGGGVLRSGDGAGFRAAPQARRSPDAEAALRERATDRLS